MSKGAGNPRRPRVAQSLRSALGDLIRSEVSDPRVKNSMVSINHVDLNRDMSVANIYVSVIGSEEAEGRKTVDVLKKAAGYLRGPLARTLKMKRAPELRFFYDDSAEFRDKLDQINHEQEKP